MSSSRCQKYDDFISEINYATVTQNNKEEKQQCLILSNLIMQDTVVRVCLRVSGCRWWQSIPLFLQLPCGEPPSGGAAKRLWSRGS